MSCQEFKDYIKEVSEEFKQIDKGETIRLISHLDADGISACSIFVKAMNQDNRKYSVSIIQQLDIDTVRELANENYNCFVFTDLGSGQISLIKEHLGHKKVFVFDHHMPESDFKRDKNLVHVNPHMFGIDGTTEVSGAGVVYLFSRSLSEKNEDMAHIALIGAIGDVQESNGLSMLNQEILETAKAKGKIRIERGLRCFGAQTKPLHKLLEYSTDPYIPGVSGNETGAIHFLQQIGIDPKQGNEWKKLIHLDGEETKKLIAAVVMKRLNEASPEDVLGAVYTLPNEEEESPLRDAREFSTLLNACGRLNRASIGVGACLGDKKAKTKAIQNLNKYRKEIINAINWFNENKGSENVIRENGSIIINAQDYILGTIAGTLASILTRSGEFEDGTLILSLAYLDRNIKASLRICGNNREIDLRRIIMKIVEESGGEAGGHCRAAGAIIPMDKEQEFMDAARKILGKINLEEAVL